MPEAQPTAEAEALRQRIAERAYVLWEEEGCSHGRDIDHWLKAEAEFAAGGNDPSEASATAARAGKKQERAAA